MGCFSSYNQHEQWVEKKKYGHVYYGSCWWTVPPTMVRYTEESLKAWTTREIMLMHYYLTSALDGYGHLTADESIKDNCLLFRKVLADRGHDGVDNCIKNEEFYNWGYRDWKYTESPIDAPRSRQRPRPRFTRIGL